MVESQQQLQTWKDRRKVTNKFKKTNQLHVGGRDHRTSDRDQDQLVVEEAGPRGDLEGKRHVVVVDSMYIQ